MRKQNEILKMALLHFDKKNFAFLNNLAENYYIFGQQIFGEFFYWGVGERNAILLNVEYMKETTQKGISIF